MVPSRTTIRFRWLAGCVAAVLGMLFLALSGGPAHAVGVTYDATGPGSAGAKCGNCSSLTWAHTDAGNALLVGVAVGKNGDGGLSATVKYNGVAMTLLKTVHTNNQTSGFLDVFGLASPAIGTHSVAVTVAGGKATEITGGSESFTGAASTGTFGTVASAFGSGITPSVATAGSTAGGIVAGFAANGSSITSATSPSTSRFIANKDTSTGAGNSAGATSPSTGSPVTMAWSVTSDWWAAIAVEVEPSGGGQQAPAVVTQAATGITDTAATLNGTVNPEGAATTYRFEYGPTTSYGTTIPVPDGSAGSGTAAVPETANVTGLTAGTGYHYRLDATNSGGTTLGSDQAFTTTGGSGCVPGTPVTITTGGSYSGCYTSTSTGTAAVTIGTTAAVTLSHATINHAGNGIETSAGTRANLTVTDSTFTATSPGGTPVHQMAVYADAPASLVIEHNQLTNGQGILVNGESLTTSPFSASYNNYTDIGRYNQADWFAGAVHTQDLTAPGGTLDWNRITSHYGTSVSEDVFGLVNTNGSSAAPVDVGNNLVNGDYPYTGDGTGFSGVAFDLADIGGSYLNAHDDTAVNYAGSGFAADSGTHVHFISDTAVSDGLADNGSRVNVSYGDGFTTWHNPAYPPSGPDLYVQNATSGHLRWNGTSWERADYYLPVCDPSASCTGDSSLGTVDGAAESSAVTAFEATAAGVMIGPRP